MTALQNPLTSLTDDVATTKRVINAQEGLHCPPYGVVRQAAASKCPNCQRETAANQFHSLLQRTITCVVLSSFHCCDRDRIVLGAIA